MLDRTSTKQALWNGVHIDHREAIALSNPGPDPSPCPIPCPIPCPNFKIILSTPNIVSAKGVSNRSNCQQATSIRAIDAAYNRQCSGSGRLVQFCRARKLPDRVARLLSGEKVFSNFDPWSTCGIVSTVTFSVRVYHYHLA